MRSWIGLCDFEGVYGRLRNKYWDIWKSFGCFAEWNGVNNNPCSKISSEWSFAFSSYNIWMYGLLLNNSVGEKRITGKSGDDVWIMRESLISSGVYIGNKDPRVSSIKC